MKLKIYFSVLFFVIAFSAFSQLKKDEVLLTVDNNKINANEFIRVYNKNLNLVQDESQKNVDEYLELYINYKLKLREAKELGFNKKDQYIKEFNKYKKQLANNYLTDNTATENLIKEAYDRVSYDVNVDHILVVLDANETDTTSVYNQVLGYRDRLIKENDFSNIKSQLHNGQTIHAEELGYFSGFKMVYAFENVAYNTPIGEVSMPFRTQFGYHVLKVNDKRESKGYATVAHIMVSNKQKDESIKPEERINEIYNLLNQGQSFESLAKQYSDDQSSAKKGGELKSFKSSQLGSVEFEDQAFALQNQGDISKPFKTAFGWHIAKLINKKPIESFDDMKSKLEAQVKRDARSKIIDETFYNGLMKRYSIPKNVDLSYFETILNDKVYSNEWSVPVSLDQNKILINFGDKQLTYHDFALYMESNQKQIAKKQSFNTFVNQLYKGYLKKRLLAYHEDNLENINPEYAAVLSEYRDGLLLFDLMQEKIWDAVKEDSIGLQKHYQENKGSYSWPKRIDANVISSSSKDILEKAKLSLEKGIDIDSIKSELNKNNIQNIIVSSGKFTKEDKALPEGFIFKKGISEIYIQNESYHIVLVKEVLEATEKSFNEAKGRVISEYQEVVEKNWITNLRSKYAVDVNQKTLKKVKKALKK
jgi:peptidyl-prolyl cis-trans isomerase SurA